MFLFLFACTAVQDTYTEQHPADGVRTLSADIGDGDLSYSARPGDFDVHWVSQGWGRDEEVAAQRQEGNRWEVGRQGSALSLFARSDTGGSVDFTVEGPSQVFTVLTVPGGDVSLSGLSGYQEVRAQGVVVSDLVGGAWLVADGSVDAELSPNPGDVVMIDATHVTLELPAGRYDLAVWAEPESVIEIDDFGFHHTAFGEGSFAGISGDGATRVDVYATGSVTIRQGW